MDRHGSFRYHFKSLDPEFGTVKEEVKSQPIRTRHISSDWSRSFSKCVASFRCSKMKLLFLDGKGRSLHGWRRIMERGDRA